MKPLYTVSSGYLVAQYAAIGVDVNRLLSAVTEFTLYEDDYGLRRWLPIVAGDEEFYINLVENIPGYYAKEKKEYEYAARWLCGEDPTLEVGCGEGLFAQLYKIMNYTGLELNGSAVKQGKRAGINILQDDFICFADRFPSSVSRLFSFHRRVSRPGDLRAKSLELLQDGVRRRGPFEGCLGLVVGRHELLDLGDQLLDA